MFFIENIQKEIKKKDKSNDIEKKGDGKPHRECAYIQGLILDVTS